MKRFEKTIVKLIIVFFIIFLITLAAYGVEGEPDYRDPEIRIEGLNGAYFRTWMNLTGFIYEKYQDYEIWKHDIFDIKIFNLEATEQFESGGLEYEFILKRKSAINKINIPIEHKGLSFYYQPEIVDFLNTTQPENVKGSYAVYYENKRDNEYKTGKLFHIYRPLLIDAENNTEWADIIIDTDKNVLKIDLPTKFLKKAKYPVIIDPTFGYTIIGGSQFNVAPNTLIFTNYTIFESGNVRKIYAYIKDRNGGNTLTRAFIYDFLEIYQHNSIDTWVNVTWGWKEFKGLNYNATINNVYWLGLINKHQTGIQCKYDIEMAFGGGTGYDVITSYGLPYQFNFDGYTANVKMSIYAEYDTFEEEPEPEPEPYLSYLLFVAIALIIVASLFLKDRND